MSDSTAIGPICQACGERIVGSHIGWNGWSYHNDHVPTQEPSPVFHVAELQPDEDSPGLFESRLRDLNPPLGAGESP